MFQQIISEIIINDAAKQNFSFHLAVTKGLENDSVDLNDVDGPLNVPYVTGR